MCSFSIIAASADTTMFSFWPCVFSELLATMKPRESAMSISTGCGGPFEWCTAERGRAPLEWSTAAGADRHGAFARLHGRQQLAEHTRPEREHGRVGRGRDDAEGAHRGDLRRDPLHDRHGV